MKVGASNLLPIRVAELPQHSIGVSCVPPRYIYNPLPPTHQEHHVLKAATLDCVQICGCDIAHLGCGLRDPMRELNRGVLREIDVAMSDRDNKGKAPTTISALIR